MKAVPVTFGSELKDDFGRSRHRFYALCERGQQKAEDHAAGK
jgi:hypothetical protein